jgi:UDP-glucose 4-epimerase
MNFRNKRVLVTGAGGFVGSRLCKALHRQGALVSGFVRRPPAEKQDAFTAHVVDMSDRSRIRQLVDEIQPELAVHLAADKNRSPDLAAYRASYETNVLGSLNLIEACEERKTLEKFVFIGSCEEYGAQAAPFEESCREAPVSAYGVTKLATTQLLQTFATARRFLAVILRPSIVFGPGQAPDMFLPALIRTLLSGQRFAMTAGDQTRDFVYVDDLVDAILQAMGAPAAQGEIINISSAQPIRIRDIAKMAAALIGPEAERLIDFGARDCRPGEALDYWAGNERAKTMLNWQPATPLEDALRQTIGHFREAASHTAS